MVLLVAAVVGCGDDEPRPNTTSPSIQDVDGDGYANNVDWFPYGQDTRDTDGDGISNAYDSTPYNVRTTPTAPQPVSPPAQTGAAPPRQIDNDQDGTPDRYDLYPLGEDARLDSDGDFIPDRRDPDPHLPSDGDTDGDGISNGTDASPYHNNDYDLDGHSNSSDFKPYDNDEY